jgi:glutamate racemase
MKDESGFRVGVFDSGVGGKSVANAIATAIPELNIILSEDSKNLPYGNKSPETLLSLVTPILQSMVEAGCQVIVVACNTVTTTIINQLRERIAVPLIGIEPMVKPAAEASRSKTITVFATPTTLASKRYKELKEDFAQGVEIVEPDCSKWSKLIEDNAMDKAVIQKNVDEGLSRGADVFVLACTHYHWIEDRIKAAAKGRALVLQPEPAIIARLKTVLKQL